MRAVTLIAVDGVEVKIAESIRDHAAEAAAKAAAVAGAAAVHAQAVADGALQALRALAQHHGVT